MYHIFEVAIPSVKGKIIIKAKGDAKYILYQYGQSYNTEKQYAIPKRTIIGKVSAAHPDKMFPNEKYQEYFPDAVLPEALPETTRSCALKIGSYSVVKKVFEEYKMPAMLGSRFDKHSGLMMDLVSYLIVDEENAGQYYPDYAFDHPLFSADMRIYSDSTVSRFFKSVTKDQMNDFLNGWNKSRGKKDRIYISYDSTNKNCQAGNIDILEYGKAKNDQGTPVFNIAVAYDKSNKVPLFYETYGGSITDVSQFSYMVDKVNSYGYKNVGFILDRGYFSKDNIRYIEDTGHAFIIMVKGCKKLVKNLILQHKGSFETDRDCSIRAYRAYGKTIVARLYEDDTADRYFHLYFNPSRQAAEREQLEFVLDRMQMFLSKHLGQNVDLPASYNEYFELTYDKKHCLVSYEERKDYIREQLNLCGYFCIISSEKMTASQALIHYKGRDISEKLFSADKSFIGSKSMRVQTVEALNTKIFVEFIALIVRNRIYNLLKETMLRLDSKYNYLTVPAALRELEKIEMVRRNNGTYKLDHAVSKKQKIILSSFGMNEDSIRTAAHEISNTLANSKSAETARDAEESEVNDDGENAFDYLD